MASVRALNSARSWTFAGGGDLRSYLLCCFSFNQSSDKKSASKSETDAELAQYLDGIDPQVSPETVVVGGDGSPADGEIEGAHSQAGIPDAVDGSTDEGRRTSSLLTDETQPQQESNQTENELREAELSRFSSSGPTDLTKEAPGESLPPGVDPNQTTDLQHDARREPLANGLRPGPPDSTLCNDSRRPEEQDGVDIIANEQTTLLTTTTATGDPTEAGQEIVNPESDEKLFDVSDLQEMSKCGRIHCTLDYSFARKRLNVTVHEASEIPNQERGGSTNTQVRLALLPAKNSRQKTKIIRANENPKYDETFQFKLPKEELNRSGLRLRLYGCERLSRERMIGECIVRFVNLNLEKPSSNWFTLEPRISFADSDRSSLGRRSRSSSAASSSSQSVEMEGMEGSSELLLSLAYNAITGRLTVDVLQGTNLKYLTTNRPPDTYVRVTLMSAGGKELTRSNTSVRKMSPNPVYREKFMFQVVETQLAEVSLMVSVYAKRSLKREELIGWFILGYNNSGEDELIHWKDMRAGGGSQVERWHVLAEP